MLIAGIYSAEAFQCSSKFYRCLCLTFSRNVNTNAAIYRGLRRSRDDRTEKSTSSSRYGSRRGDYEPYEGRGLKSREKTLSRERRNEKPQERTGYRVQGRYSPKKMERMGLSSARSSRPHSGRSSPQDEPPGYSRNRGGRYDSAEQFPQRTYTSDRSVDPSRRAKHQSRTIDDWTSSKHDDSGARRLTSESSSELHVPGDTASRKSTRYEDFDDMQDDDDVPVFGRDQTRQDAWDSSGKSSILPLTIPYTTPASEFLYGTSVVTAALKSNRRKLYKLYMYNGENREVANQDEAMRKLALAAGVEIVQVGRDWMRLMDKMSAGRPHNVRLPTLIRSSFSIPKANETRVMFLKRLRCPDCQSLDCYRLNASVDL